MPLWDIKETITRLIVVIITQYTEIVNIYVARLKLIRYMSIISQFLEKHSISGAPFPC